MIRVFLSCLAAFAMVSGSPLWAMVEIGKIDPIGQDLFQKQCSRSSNVPVYQLSWAGKKLSVRHVGAFSKFDYNIELNIPADLQVIGPVACKQALEADFAKNNKLAQDGALNDGSLLLVHRQIPQVVIYLTPIDEAMSSKEQPLFSLDIYYPTALTDPLAATDPSRRTNSSTSGYDLAELLGYAGRVALSAVKSKLFQELELIEQSINNAQSMNDLEVIKRKHLLGR